MTTFAVLRRFNADDDVEIGTVEGATVDEAVAALGGLWQKRCLSVPQAGETIVLISKGDERPQGCLLRAVAICS